MAGGGLEPRFYPPKADISSRGQCEMRESSSAVVERLNRISSHDDGNNNINGHYRNDHNYHDHGTETTMTTTTAATTAPVFFTAIGTHPCPTTKTMRAVRTLVRTDAC
ncbi:unnamed protein product [Ectocarpus fasciculatus]